MRISTLDISHTLSTKHGLKEDKIHRLGNVVAIIGKNGSGKSRFLKIIREELFQLIDLSNILEGDIKCLSVHQQELYNKYIEVKEYVLLEKQYLLLKNTLTEKDKSRHLELQGRMNEIHAHAQRLRKQNPILVTDFINKKDIINESIRENFFIHIKWIDYNEIHQLKIGDNTGKVTFEDLIETVNNSYTANEFTLLSESALTFLAKLPHLLVRDYQECLGKESEYNKLKSFKRYDSLRNIVKSFLGKDLIWKKRKVKETITEEGVNSTSVGEWYLDNRLFDYTEFSDGEKTLFAYCLFFFLLEQNPKTRIKDCIILIDEPELHLHPSAELALINGVKEIIKDNGRLFISTHSINILSELSYDEIFMIKKGEITPPKKTTPGEIFIELTGNYIDKLIHFVANISNWAFLNFMTECFSNPEVINSAKKGDPQVEVFKKSIQENINGKILLDFGAGQGRIYREISDDDLLLNRLQYYALEPFEDNVEELKRLSIQKIYHHYSELPSNQFDYVLLCNVLHEIPITMWERNLNKISESLTENGFIIIIEDLRLPKGEKIDEAGFLILDLNSLKNLFSMASVPASILASDKAYKDRIQCAIIQKSDIGEITRHSIINAMISSQEYSLNRLKTLRKESSSSINHFNFGRESALYSQLFVNAEIAKEIIGKD